MRSRFIAVLWLLTAIFCVVLVTDVVPWVRGQEPWLPGDLSWVWNYGAPRWGWLIVCIVGVIIYTLGITRLLENYPDSDTRFPVKIILWSFVGSVLITLLVMTIEQGALFLLFTRSASLVTGGYQYSSVMMSNLGDVLRHWPQFVASYKARYWINSVTVSPPGIDATYYAFSRIFEAVPALGDVFGGVVRPFVCQNDYMMSWTNGQLASAWFQMGMPIWASLAVAPLYRVGVLVFNRKIARQAIALWPLVPGLMLFSPRFNVGYALVAIVVLSLTWYGLIKRRPVLIVLAGFAVGTAAFTYLVNLPIGLMALLTILGWQFLEHPGWGPTIRDALLLGVSSTLIWVIYYFMGGLTFTDMLSTIFGYHFAVTNRPYWPWIIQHPIDMWLFVGLPLTVLVLWRVWQLAKNRRLMTRADLFVGVAFLTFLATDLSGVNQGETGRIWLIFAPAWLLVGSEILTQLKARTRFALIAMQVAVMLCMAAVLRVHFTALTLPATAETATTTPQFPVNAEFVNGTDHVTLVGLDVDKAPTSVTIRLYWRSDSVVSRPYFMSIVPVPPDKSAMDAVVFRPGQWTEQSYPPSCWLPGQVFTDSVTIPLGAKAQPGNWLFSLAITDVYTRVPMTVLGQSVAQVGIGPVNVPAASVAQSDVGAGVQVSRF